MKEFVYLIAFGGNTGDRVQFARGSLLQLQAHGSVGRQSEWITTEPLRSEVYETHDHGSYLNFVFEFISSLNPSQLYSKICEIEDYFGHDREQRWRPRAVDLDLLFYCEKVGVQNHFVADSSIRFTSREGTLEIPHPEIWKRDFLLHLIELDLLIPIANLRNNFNKTLRQDE